MTALISNAIKFNEALIRNLQNNLSLANVNGAKESIMEFTDNIYIQDKSFTPAEEGQMGTTGIYKGTGSSIQGTYRNQTMGEIEKTDSPITLVINGAGYIGVMLANGTRAYTRNGNLQINRDRRIAFKGSGELLAQDITIPIDINESTIKIEDDGRVTAVNQNNELLELGRIQIYTFPNEQGIRPIGNTMFLATESSGEAIENTPGENGAGTCIGNYIEKSNVDLYKQLIQLNLALQNSTTLAQVGKMEIDLNNKILDIFGSK